MASSKTILINFFLTWFMASLFFFTLPGLFLYQVRMEQRALKWRRPY